MNVNNPDITAVATYWPEMAGTVFVPHTEAEFRRLKKIHTLRNTLFHISPGDQ
jgi:hypothetical protein